VLVYLWHAIACAAATWTLTVGLWTCVIGNINTNSAIGCNQSVDLHRFYRLSV
jgi:hypothetical protein